MAAPLQVALVFGTRPDSIKMAPIVLSMQKERHIQPTVYVTGQHRDILDQVLQVFHITPEHDLNIMQHGQTMCDITTRCLNGLYRLFSQKRPDIVLVYGDTLTSFSGALAAFYQKIPVGHVEAGLRTYNKYSPYPEEINRCMISKIADLHFAPTNLNKRNLICEHILNNIYVTGNTAIDVLKYTIKDHYVFQNDRLNQIDYDSLKTIVVTTQRRENIGKNLENICKAILKLHDTHKDIQFVYPVPLNQKLHGTVDEMLSGHSRIHLTPPIDVFDMHNLLGRCYLVMTDSGGLQEEAPALNKPVVILRDTTERSEGVVSGTAVLSGTNTDKIYRMVNELLTKKSMYLNMANAHNPYGDGNSASRIIAALYKWAKERDLNK